MCKFGLSKDKSNENNDVLKLTMEKVEQCLKFIQRHQ